MIAKSHLVPLRLLSLALTSPSLPYHAESPSLPFYPFIVYLFLQLVNFSPFPSRRGGKQGERDNEEIVINENGVSPCSHWFRLRYGFDHPVKVSCLLLSPPHCQLQERFLRRNAHLLLRLLNASSPYLTVPRPPPLSFLLSLTCADSTR